MCDLPLAEAPYISYRCRSPYGWVMIAADDHEDAMREARRSNPNLKREDLQIWDGKRYIPC